MRAAQPSDFIVPVQGIGTFTFGRRTLGDQVAIRREFLRLNGDNQTDEDMLSVCTVIATLMTLCVKAPAGWEDPERIDLLADPDAFDKLFNIADALKEKEDSFRRRMEAKVETGGEGTGGDGPLLVPEKVQPAA